MMAWPAATVVLALLVLCLMNLISLLKLDAQQQQLRAQREQQIRCVAETDRLDKELDAAIRPILAQQMRVQSMLRWCQSKEDFLVTSGEKLVSFATASPRHYGKLNVRVFIPPGNHRLKYAFKEVWGEDHQPQNVRLRETDPRQWENVQTLELPTGEVHELEFLIESDDQQSELRVVTTDHSEQRYPLKHSKCNGYGAGTSIVARRPNELQYDIDKLKAEMASIAPPLNEIANHSFSLHDWDDKKQAGGVAVRCWLESDGPRVLEAHRLARLHDWLISPDEDAQVKFDEMFEPYSGNGVFRLNPKQWK